MRKLLTFAFAFLLLAAPVVAQSVPPQFSTLLTSGIAQITGCSVNGSNTVVFTTSSNTFVAGATAVIEGLTGGCASALNEAQLTVSATGLSNTGFQAPFTHAAISFTSDSGTAAGAVDLTCAGLVPCSSWPMPANPGMGSSWTDTTWGTTTWELDIPSENTFGSAIPIYARNQGFSSDNKYLLMTEAEAGGQVPYVDLYDATTNPPTPINRISITDGTICNPTAGDCYWANQIPTRIYYIPWGYPATGDWLQLRYIDITNCHTGAGNCTLTSTTVHTFSGVSDQYTSPDTSGQVIGYMAISSYVILSGTITVTGTGNQFTSGKTAVLEGFTGGSAYLNGTSLTVSATGLSSTTFQAPTALSNASATASGYAGTPGNAIESSYTGSQGNMFDLTDTYFTFGLDYTFGGGTAAEIDLIRYNKSTDTVTTQVKWYTICPGGVPSGCGIWTDPSGEDPNQGYNMYRMAQHPDANYITLVYLCAWSVNADVARGCGTEAFGPTWNFLGYISVENVHQDNGYDVNNVPISVIAETSIGSPPDQDYWSAEVVNLTTLSTTAITSKQLQISCSWIYGGSPCPGPPNRNKAWHISGTATWGSGSISGCLGCYLFSSQSTNGENGYNVTVPVATTLGTAVTSAGSHTVTPASMASIGIGTGQLIDYGSGNVETVTVTGVTGSTFTATFTKTHLSTAPVSNLTVGDAGPYSNENLMVLIDTTAASGSYANIWRLGRTMSIRDGDYDAEPHSSFNRNGTAYIWGSNWNVDGALANGYYSQLTIPPSWTVTISPSGGGTVTGTNCSNNNYTSGQTIGPCTATASTGYSLASTIWTAVSGSAGCTGSTNPCASFSITANSAATANFTINSYTVTTSVSGSGSVTGCPTGSYTYNSTVNCTATPSAGNTFVGWSGTCGLTGTTSPTSFTQPANACTVIATFNPFASDSLGPGVSLSPGTKIQ